MLHAASVTMIDSPAMVVVADDDPRIIEVASRALCDHFQVLGADDGDKALVLARAIRPAALILDLSMPRVNGWRVLLALKRNAATSDMPVIVLTGEGDQEVACLDAGADDYLPKPFTPVELRARVAALVRRHRRSISANPVTFLPGVSAIHEVHARIARLGLSAGLLHVDIDDFKRVNDEKGFLAGNDVIRATGDLLAGIVRAAERPTRQLAHIGGDDFAILCPSEETEVLARAIVQKFDAAAAEGGPLQGQTLSVGVALSGGTSLEALASATASAKAAAKARPRRVASHFEVR